ncbi:hypothetical protein E2C01_006787 [Portunus trituberculatus]|uniref:Uncharacterized protein n=1 Tax=Portunus trituberculatus TaxID=210409 RepID=A0A5B7CZ28_PORTR|nr:hypothetical protein [Portunus trituberculatus]
MARTRLSRTFYTFVHVKQFPQETLLPTPHSWYTPARLTAQHSLLSRLGQRFPSLMFSPSVCTTKDPTTSSLASVAPISAQCVVSLTTAED